jgi:hypothetical protein
MAETRQEKVQRLHETLTAQIEAVQSSADWRRLLDIAARLHRYSFGNQILIAAAHALAYEAGLVPADFPTMVAGFHTWRALGRTVEKGQKGFPILAPARYRSRSAQEPDGTLRPLRKGESPQHGEEVVRGTEQVKGWTVEHVFDVSQTSGEPLPTIDRPTLLTGGAPDGLWAGLVRFAASKAFTVHEARDAHELEGANGLTRWADKTLWVRGDMPDAARSKTLAHAVGHLLLHDPGLGTDIASMPRALIEVEAESVAYILGAAHGLDTSEYSLPYVASWAGGDKPADAVRASAQRVTTAARQILAELDTDHGLGGQPPGIAAALQARTERRSAPAMAAAPERAAFGIEDRS